jgi:hypothetical protein
MSSTTNRLVVSAGGCRVARGRADAQCQHRGRRSSWGVPCLGMVQQIASAPATIPQSLQSVASAFSGGPSAPPPPFVVPPASAANAVAPPTPPLPPASVIDAAAGVRPPVPPSPDAPVADAVNAVTPPAPPAPAVPAANAVEIGKPPSPPNPGCPRRAFGADRDVSDACRPGAFGRDNSRQRDATGAKHSWHLGHGRRSPDTSRRPSHGAERRHVGCQRHSAAGTARTWHRGRRSGQHAASAGPRNRPVGDGRQPVGVTATAQFPFDCRPAGYRCPTRSRFRPICSASEPIGLHHKEIRAPRRQ